MYTKHNGIKSKYLTKTLFFLNMYPLAPFKYPLGIAAIIMCVVIIILII